MNETALAVLLSALGVLASGAFGAWLQRRKDTMGYYFRPPRRRRRYSGLAADMALSASAVRFADGDVSLGDDFQRLGQRRWALDYRFAYIGSCLELTGSAEDSDGRAFSIRGSGKVHGTDASGISFIDVSGAGQADHGNMVYILKWSNPDALHGYWIASDSDQLGRLAMGTLRLRLQQSETG